MIVCGFVTAIKRPVVDVKILMSVCSFKDDVCLHFTSQVVSGDFCDRKLQLFKCSLNKPFSTISPVNRQ